MKTFFLLLFFLTYSLESFASIYGPYNRADIFKASPEIQALARSTVVMLRRSEFTRKSDRLVYDYPKPEQLGTIEKLKKDEPFYTQPTHGYCSGVLIAKNKILTAHHCVDDEKELENTVFAFDYQLSSDEETTHEHLIQNVYKIKKVFRDELASDGIAVVELTREVIDREPVEFQKNGAVQLNEIFTIHYPSGLPAKYSDGGWVKSIYESKRFNGTAFRSNLDIFGGSSGSPIFDVKSKKLIGLTMAGGKDYRREFFVFKRKNVQYELDSKFTFEIGREIDDTTVSFFKSETKPKK